MRGKAEIPIMKGFESGYVVEPKITQPDSAPKEAPIEDKGWESFNDNCASGVVVKDYGLNKHNVSEAYGAMQDAVDAQFTLKGNEVDKCSGTKKIVNKETEDDKEEEKKEEDKENSFAEEGPEEEKGFLKPTVESARALSRGMRKNVSRELRFDFNKNKLDLGKKLKPEYADEVKKWGTKAEQEAHKRAFPGQYPPTEGQVRGINANIVKRNQPLVRSEMKTRDYNKEAFGKKFGKPIEEARAERRKPLGYMGYKELDDSMIVEKGLIGNAKNAWKAGKVMGRVKDFTGSPAGKVGIHAAGIGGVGTAAYAGGRSHQRSIQERKPTITYNVQDPKKSLVKWRDPKTGMNVEVPADYLRGRLMNRREQPAPVAKELDDSMVVEKGWGGQALSGIKRGITAVGTGAGKVMEGAGNYLGRAPKGSIRNQMGRGLKKRTPKNPTQAYRTGRNIVGGTALLGGGIAAGRMSKDVNSNIEEKGIAGPLIGSGLINAGIGAGTGALLADKKQRGSAAKRGALYGAIGAPFPILGGAVGGGIAAHQVNKKVRDADRARLAKLERQVASNKKK